MKILLFGKKGQVGSSIIKISEDYKISSFDKSEINFVNVNKVTSLISSEKPDIIINAVAYTKVDEAEKNKDLCFQINARTVEEIAKTASKIGAVLIHFSTDYIFDGSSKNYYKEEDNAKPINVYGKSKLAAEEAIVNSNCKYYILRTSWIVSENENNFLNTMVKLILKKEKIKVVHDQFGVPTTSDFIAKYVIKLIEKDFINSEIFNLTPSGSTNWFEFAKYIKIKLSDLDNEIKNIEIKPIISKEYITPAKRPTNSILDSQKIQNFLQTKFERWEHYIDDLMRIKIEKIKSGEKIEI